MDVKKALKSGGKPRSRRYSRKSKKSRKSRKSRRHSGGFSGVKFPLSPAHVGGKKTRGGKTRKGGSQLPALALLGTLLATGPKKHKRSKRHGTRKGMRRKSARRAYMR